jgi:Terpene synthase family 2, C-terminal metal binding
MASPPAPIQGQTSLDPDFASGKPLQQTPCMLEATARVYPALNIWAADYPVIATGVGADRLRWSVVAMTACFDGVPDDILLDLAILCAILFGYDDVMDGRYGLADLRILADFNAECMTAFEFSQIRPDRKIDSDSVCQFLAAVADCGQRLRQYRYFEGHRSQLLVYLDATFRSNLQEAAWRLGRDKWPTVDRYLDNARRSLFEPVFRWFALVMVGPDALERHMTNRFATVALDAAWCMRVSNDICGLDRDRREGVPNVVSLLAQERDCCPSEAADALRGWLHRRMTGLSSYFRDVPQEMCDHYRWLARTVQFMCSWYLNLRDYEMG